MGELARESYLVLTDDQAAAIFRELPPRGCQHEYGALRWWCGPFLLALPDTVREWRLTMTAGRRG